MPFFSVRMPESFQRANPEAMHNLRLNSRKLTTPFDIHETLKHFLNFDNSSALLDTPPGDHRSRMPRGISLLKRIPANRACNDAQIEAHWCSCLNWIDLNITSSTNNNPDNNNNRSPSDDLDLLSIESDSSSQTTDGLNKNSTKNDSNGSVVNLTSRRQKLDMTELTRIRTNLARVSARVVEIGKRAVAFINSLMADRDVRAFCHPLQLHSIQKLSKLDLNRRLLAFKMSKDIHGREALFDDDPSSNSTHRSSNYSSRSTRIEDEFSVVDFTTTTKTSPIRFSNSTASDVSKETHTTSETTRTYQIIFTTWPGNATYELSFRFGRANGGTFEFNRNEISRINSYNTTSNCMVNKRPDLRQYCFCKYV